MTIFINLIIISYFKIIINYYRFTFSLILFILNNYYGKQKILKQFNFLLLLLLFIVIIFYYIFMLQSGF